jgi:hypothetical protein
MLQFHDKASFYILHNFLKKRTLSRLRKQVSLVKICLIRLCVSVRIKSCYATKSVLGICLIKKIYKHYNQTKLLDKKKYVQLNCKYLNTAEQLLLQ